MILLSFKYIFLIIEMWNHEKKMYLLIMTFALLKNKKTGKTVMYGILLDIYNMEYKYEYKG